MDTELSVKKKKKTFMRTISSGMFIMAPVNQFSRLLAKLRMAWVKAPDGGDAEERCNLQGYTKTQEHFSPF